MTGRALPPPGLVDVWWIDRTTNATCGSEDATADIDLAARIGAPERRRRFLQSRRAVRHILSAHYLDAAPHDVPLHVTSDGKPVLQSTGIAFSLSHCDAWTSFVVSRATTIGVDAACDDELDRSAAALPLRSIVTAREATMLAGLPAGTKQRRLWVGKEAVGKALGRGLLADLSTIEIGLDEASPRLIETTHGQLVLVDCPAPEGVTAAICVAPPFAALRMRSNVA